MRARVPATQKGAHIMKKIALTLAAAAFGAFVACDGTDTTPCPGGDPECVGTTNSVGDATPVCDDDGAICVPELCTENTECQVTDAGGSDNCAGDDDCADDEACLPGDQGNGHCVFVNDPAGSDCGEFEGVPLEEVTVDGTPFCADPDVSCEDPGRCAGGTFD